MICKRYVIKTSLTGIFRRLYMAQTLEELGFYYIYIDGLVEGLELGGCLSNEQVTELIDLRNIIYDKKKANSPVSYWPGPKA